MITLKSNKPTFTMYHNDTMKWTKKGKTYCLHVEQDYYAENPRRGYGEYESIMACFHRDYDLGDKIPEKEPEAFWKRLVRENCSAEDVLLAIKERYLNMEVSVLENGHVDGDLSISECMILMNRHAAWMPLWVYEHSGLTISCGERVYPYSDRWDSYGVGWIITVKKGSKTDNESDDEWEKRVMENMEMEVKEYDEYLTGDVYEYTLYEKCAGEWEKMDCCGMFFGADTLENGILDTVGYGCKEAYEHGTFEKGTATERLVRVFEF